MFQSKAGAYITIHRLFYIGHNRLYAYKEEVRMASVGAGSLLATFLLMAVLLEGASGEQLTRCFDNTATARLTCGMNSLIWVKGGFYGVASDTNFCSSPSVSQGMDCRPNEAGHRWSIAADCNLFSSCMTFYKPFQAEASQACRARGPTYSHVAYECLSRFKSDLKTLIDFIFLSTEEPSQDVVDDKFFLMSERYASPTSSDTGYCKIQLPAKSGARFEFLDLRGQTIPASAEKCPYKLFIYSGDNYREWCAGSGFVPEEYLIESSDSESVIDVVFKKVVPNGSGAVWLLMEGKRDDGKEVTGMKVNCGRTLLQQNLLDRLTMRETTTSAATTEAGRGPGGPADGDILGPGPADGRIYYIFKSTMAAKVPGADGFVDTMAISRDSKGTNPNLRMSVFSRDFGQQWYFDGQRIRNRVDNKCMAVNDRKQLVLVDCQDRDRTQAWVVQKDLGVFKNAELGDVIEVTNNLPNSGALLGVGPSKDARYQKFIFEEAPKYFTIVSRSNGKVATLSSITERSKIVFQAESETPRDSQIFYEDKKRVIRTKINNFGLDTRSGTAVALRFLGVNKDNNWTYDRTHSKIVNKGETASSPRVLQIKTDLTLATAKSTNDPNQIFDIRYID